MGEGQGVGEGRFQKNKKYSDGNSGENTKGTIDGENFSGGWREGRGGRGWSGDAVLKRTDSPKEFRSTERGPGKVMGKYSFTALKFF